VPVTGGVFTTQLDMSAVFRKGFVEGKWMQIGVRRVGTTGAYTQLSPRQQLTAAPFAVNARNVSGGFVQIPVNADVSADKCNDQTRGQMVLIGGSSTNTLRICTFNGWKIVSLP
jgi:hypothetical protein